MLTPNRQELRLGSDRVRPGDLLVMVEIQSRRGNRADSVPKQRFSLSSMVIALLSLSIWVPRIQTLIPSFFWNQVWPHGQIMANRRVEGINATSGTCPKGKRCIFSWTLFSISVDCPVGIVVSRLEWQDIGSTLGVVGLKSLGIWHHGSIPHQAKMANAWTCM